MEDPPQLGVTSEIIESTKLGFRVWGLDDIAFFTPKSGGPKEFGS